MNSSKRNRSCRRLRVSCAGLISSSGELGSEYPLDSPRSAPCLASSSLDLAPVRAQEACAEGGPIAG